MATTTVSIEDFQKDADRVDEASAGGPLYLMRSGRKTLVVLDIDEYRKLGAAEPSILELLAMPGVGDIEFEPPRMGTEPYSPVHLFD